MRTSMAAVPAAGCLLAAACSAPGPGVSAASCAAPLVETEPRQAQPGEPITVRGNGYSEDCNDTGEQRTARAYSDLQVWFEQDGTSVELGTVDATGPTGEVLTTVTVPADAQAGPARVTVGVSEPALVMVGDGRGGFPPWPGPPTGPFELSIDLRSVPAHPEGGWVLASATTVDELVPEADRQATAAEPLGADRITFGPLAPSYWTVGVRVHLCETAECRPPVPESIAQACEMEARTIDGPVVMTYGPGPCDLRTG